jgi:hypothetical protein
MTGPAALPDGRERAAVRVPAGPAARMVVLAVLPGVVLATNRPPLPLRVLRTAVAGAVPRPHVHWFRWKGEEPYGNGSLYLCRCGVVRSGF